MQVYHQNPSLDTFDAVSVGETARELRGYVQTVQEQVHADTGKFDDKTQD